MPDYQLNIDALNAICVRMGGAGAHRLHIDALNEWSLLAGAGGGHRRSVGALNAIAAQLGGSGGHRFNLDALDEIAVRLGGAGGEDRHVELLDEIAALVAAVPAAPAIQSVAFGPLPPRVGEAVTAVVGRTGVPVPALTWRWRRDGTDIPGATGPSYSVAAGDLGQALSVAVTAGNSEGSASAESPPAEVLGAPAAPVSLAAPAIAGVPQVGATLTVESDGEWSGATGLARNWQRDGVDIPGAAGAGYVPVAGDAGCTIRLRVTASAAAGVTTAHSAGFAVVAGVTHVFVDSLGGSDAAGGGTPAAAVRTLARATALAAGIGAGAAIRLKRGGVWDEQLVLDQTGALVAAYGSTAEPMPLVRCSDAVAPGAFAPVDGAAGVYAASVAHAFTNPAKVSTRVFEDGRQLAWVVDLAACAVTPGSFTYDGAAIGVSPLVVRVHPRGSTDPRADGKAYRVVTRPHGVRLSGVGAVIDGIHATQNGHNDGALAITAPDGTIRNCLATWGSVHNLLAWARGARVEGSVAYRTRPNSGNATSFVAYHSDPVAGSVQYVDCWAHPLGADELAAPGVAPGAGIGFFAHTNGGDATIPAQTLLGCVSRRSATGAAAGNLGAGIVHVQDCYFDNDRDAISGGANLTVENVVFVSDAAVNGGPGQFVGGSGSQAIRDARVCLVGPALDIFDGDGPAEALSVRDSILWTSRTAIPSDPIHVTVEGSVIRAREFYDRPDGAVAAASGNVFVTGAPGAVYRVGAVDHPSLAAYRAAHPALEAGSAETADAGGLSEAGMLGNDWSNVLGAGSGRALRTPDWAFLTGRWEAGFLGADEIVASDGAPWCLAAPRIAGAAAPGEVLSVVPASWYGRPRPAVAWQWRRDGADIGGAVGATYAVAAADAGAALSVVETAASALGVATAASPAVTIAGGGIADIAELWAAGEAGTLLDFSRSAGLCRVAAAGTFRLGQIANGQDIRFCEDGRFGYARGQERIDADLTAYPPANGAWTLNADGTHTLGTDASGGLSVDFGKVVEAPDWCHAVVTVTGFASAGGQVRTRIRDWCESTQLNGVKTAHFLGKGGVGNGHLEFTRNGSWVAGNTVTFGSVSVRTLSGQRPAYQASNAAGSGATYSVSAPHAVFAGGALVVDLPDGVYTIGIARPTGAAILAGVAVTGGTGYALDQSCSALVVVGRPLSAAETAFLTAWLDARAGLA